MHAHGHKDVTTCRHGTQNYSHGQQAPEGHPPHTLRWGTHRIGLLDRYGSPTKCKKARSCDIYNTSISRFDCKEGYDWWK